MNGHISISMEQACRDQFLWYVSDILRSDITPLLDIVDVLAPLEPLEQLFRVKLDADGVFFVTVRPHVLVCVFRVVKIIDLGLDLIAVRVEIIHARRRPVVDAPLWQDGVRLPLRVGQQ